MAEETSLAVMHERNKKDLAKYRAEKRLAELTTVEDRLRANKFMYAIFVFNAVPMGVSLAWCWFVHDYLGLLFGPADFLLAGVQASVVLLNFFFILFANNMFIRNDFKRKEMKRLDAEDEYLKRAERLRRKYPNYVPLQIASKNLLEAIRKPREGRDEGEDEILQLESGDFTEVEEE